MVFKMSLVFKVRFFIFVFLTTVLLFCASVFASTATPSVEPDEPSSGIFDQLSDFLLHLIVPEETYFTDKFDELKDTLSLKFPYATYIEVIDRLKLIVDEEPDLSFYDQHTSIDGIVYDFKFSHWIGGYVPTIRSLIAGIMYLLLAYYNYRQIIYFIRGSNYQGTKKDD
jgi:hypothetical protein